jgi:cell pole-organizing protein PopZ
MSALNAHTPNSSLDDERRAHEPSMEEILASIRRIIADDDVGLSVRRERQDRRKIDDVQPEPRKAAEPEAPAPRVVAVEETPAADGRAEVELSRYDEEKTFHDAPSAVDEEEEDDEEEAVFAEHDAAEEAEAVGGDAYPEHEHAELEYNAREQDAFSPAENSAPLVSSDAAAAIAAQFQTLAASMVINDSGLLHDYAREMLRPMLKAWLDDNLPVLVERLVRAEIERVARGGRR